MSKKVTVIVVIAILVLGGGAFLLFGRHTPNTGGATGTSGGNTSTQTGTTDSTLASDSMSPSFAINANDDSADHETISVKQGASVSLTFKVDTSGVYHGGLQFKSTDPAIDSGPIAPGSAKTVTFTADHSFSFTPYWYASQVQKDYLITVTVS